MEACHQRTSEHDLAVVIIKSVHLSLPHMTRNSSSHQRCITSGGECMSSTPPWDIDSWHLVRAGGDAVEHDLPPMWMQASLTKLSESPKRKEGHETQRALLGMRDGVYGIGGVWKRAMGWEQLEFIICSYESVKAEVNKQEEKKPSRAPSNKVKFLCLMVSQTPTYAPYNIPIISIKSLCDKVQ